MNMGKMTELLKQNSKGTRGKDFEKSALSIAFAIQKSIKAKGTKARPFLFPAFRKYESKVINIINNAINRVI